MYQYTNILPKVSNGVEKSPDFEEIMAFYMSCQRKLASKVASIRTGCQLSLA
jgi:hypothetical protein